MTHWTRWILGPLLWGIGRATAAGAQDSTSLRPSDSTASRSPIGTVAFANRPYGSQAYFSPLTVLLNKGFDHFQAINSPRKLFGQPYGRAFRNGVWDALRHPGDAVRHAPGWRQWLRTEILPLTFTSGEARWFVNYGEHLIAGGLTYRALEEWYRLRDLPVPKVWAAATTLAAAMTNEAMENPMVERAASSTVADLYFFDIPAVLLFNWDPLVRFFAGTLQAADWSNMATLTLPNAELRNVGQYYILKIPLPKTETRAFVRAGMGLQAGISRPVGGGHAVTVALGADTKVRWVDPVTRTESISMVFGGGVYVDRHNSLLAAFTVSPNVHQLSAQIYPGVWPGRWRDVGTWIARDYQGRITGGLVHRRALGLGIGLGR